MVDAPMDGVAAVVRGKSAYVDVNIKNQRQFFAFHLF